MLLVPVFCSVIHLWCPVCLVSAMGNNVVRAGAPANEAADIAKDEKPKPVIATKKHKVNVPLLIC
jgi:hypothetical protein